ncbi:hypothetical protein Lade_0855 [Legionella adelaidensis]|uniref:Uncharacterized protein n=1 Tax=Legionella adelaidensis TaxID=45056 RepID=A0A0W0R589_9GAMM|nr:hypothetical protein [Legionella adelaidensis]KTC66197.1 hypothetical protein Lade_0855 [Legionella adelaidensis]
MNKTLIALATATALTCAPFVFAADSDGNGSDNGSMTSSSTDASMGSSTSTTGMGTTTTTPTTGTTMSTTTMGNTIESLSTSTSKHVDIGLKTADGKVINAVVETSDLMGLKTGDQVSLTMPPTSTMTTTTP